MLHPEIKDPTPELVEGVTHVHAALGGDVFWSTDGREAIILSPDSRYAVSVRHHPDNDVSFTSAQVREWETGVEI